MLDAGPNGSIATLADEALVLVSWWKPLIYLIVFALWARIVTEIYDPHAARYILPRKKWAVAHLVAGTLALAAAFLIPIEGGLAFWVGLLAMMAILGADLAAYPLISNKDPRVPASGHVKIDFGKITAAREAKKQAKLRGKSVMVIRQPDKQILVVPQQDTPEYDVRTAAEGIVARMLDTRASQAEIGPTGKGESYAPVYWIDGVKSTGEAMPAASAIKVMDLWKAAAKLDLADRRKKLTGDTTIEMGTAKRKIRVSSIGVQGGMRLTLLLDPEQSVNRQPNELGLLDAQLAELKSIVEEGKGVVLLSAPADGGRTTTYYGVLKLHDAYTNNVQTLEIEPQAALDGVRQNRFDPQADGQDYATTARSILRRDPDVLALADLPDANTAKEAAKSELERVRVYLSIRADNAVQAVQAYVKAVGDNELAGRSVHGVVAQKLMRKLCGNCRVEYAPAPDMLKKMGVTEKVAKLYKKGGQVLIKNKPEVCPACQGTGYLGQTGIFEVYALGPEERQLIAAGDFAGLKAQLRKKMLPSIQSAAIRKAVEGITSIEEVTRATAEAAPAGGPGAAAPAKPAARPPAKA
ncbi:MAG: Flp pilus assembly complex ATPase component TadA [Phycisphaerae bacterium]|nr:Flp pilus assembly complex ATPase component TadA [Phycisphaerae bacterium]